MSYVNRSAVLVRPRKPFLAWCKEDDTTGVAESVFESLRSAPTTFLIPEDDEAGDVQMLIRDVWPAVFEAMLEGWLTDPAMWPGHRTWEKFVEWFEFDVSESVQDLVFDEPLDAI